MTLQEKIEKVLEYLRGRIENPGPDFLVKWTEHYEDRSVQFYSTIPRDILLHIARQQGCLVIHDGPVLSIRWPDGLMMKATRVEQTDAEKALGEDVWIG